jgi:F-type H+-transporting ATPase subunit beta
MVDLIGEGKVVAVRGAVVDVRFDGAQALPPVNSALTVLGDRPQTLVLEVHSHVDTATVRAIALRATSGLARGIAVQATGAPLSVPVARAAAPGR